MRLAMRAGPASAESFGRISAVRRPASLVPKRRPTRMVRRAIVLLAAALLAGCAPQPAYDLLIRGGTIYDGSGAPPLVGDVAIRGDRIAYIGPRASGTARRTIDATGRAEIGRAHV